MVVFAIISDKITSNLLYFGQLMTTEFFRRLTIELTGDWAAVQLAFFSIWPWIVNYKAINEWLSTCRSKEKAEEGF